ncbi:hypothetical protein ADL12_39520 [Streptomyces regalis]|uniref:Uncharacterized protein n=1 Tax=Streptomyces regalis TaxID=68262 RepID=A0A101JAX1_9ACTN|nr:hypothetical protein ADL12_39520 [Streptomyces regalis]
MTAGATTVVLTSGSATLDQFRFWQVGALSVRVDRTRLGLTVPGVVLAATATGAAGPIGFVALTAPQLAPRLTRTPQLPLFNSPRWSAGRICCGCRGVVRRHAERPGAVRLRGPRSYGRRIGYRRQIVAVSITKR